jgi:hypothetical protein
MSSDELPVEQELMRSVLRVELEVERARADDRRFVVEGRLGSQTEPDVARAGMGLLFAIGALSFEASGPHGAAGPGFLATDEWTAGDLLRHLRFERGELRFSADYVRGRHLATELVVRPDGAFRLTTVDRGEAALAWVAQLRGQRVSSPAGDAPAPTPPLAGPER